MKNTKEIIQNQKNLFDQYKKAKDEISYYMKSYMKSGINRPRMVKPLFLDETDLFCNMAEKYETIFLKNYMDGKIIRKKNGKYFEIRSFIETSQKESTVTNQTEFLFFLRL